MLAVSAWARDAPPILMPLWAHTRHRPRSRPEHSRVAMPMALAAIAALAIVATEYVFRHHVLFWMPTLGSLRVNDMVALLLAYSLLVVSFGALARVRWREELPRLAAALREFVTRWTFVRWAVALMFAVVVLSVVDQLLLARYRLPMEVSSYRNPAVWFPQGGQVLGIVALIAVNGFFVPVAEEFLWRGFIQPRLSLALPATLAIGTTAVLFSLKHVVVDASWARFLTLVAFGAMCGIVAHRHSWRSSAALHAIVNTAATTAGLAMAA